MGERRPTASISFSFKEICKIAKHIKPESWCIVASDQRLAFIEINLPHNGPATLHKQLILNNYMQVEAYVGANKISENALNTNDINSVVALEECLRIFNRFSTCVGNRNFHRASPQNKVEYWRHANCLLLYEKDIKRKEQCCDTCLSLNNFLTKKQREQVIPYIYDEYPDLKRVKTEIDIKSEPVDDF